MSGRLGEPNRTGIPDRPEESRIVRSAMTERMVEHGFPRKLAEQMADESYKRVEAQIEAALRYPQAAK